MTRTDAITALGSYARNARTGHLIENRIDNLLRFSAEHPGATISVVANNSWSKPPRANEAISATLLGGTTYRYHVWACVYA